jgi:hypothetical protein
MMYLQICHNSLIIVIESRYVVQGNYIVEQGGLMLEL